MINRISKTYSIPTINSANNQPQKTTQGVQKDVFVKSLNNVAFKGLSGEAFDFVAFYAKVKQAKALRADNLLTEASKLYKKCFFEVESHIFHNCDQYMRQFINVKMKPVKEPELFPALKIVTTDLCSTLCESGKTNKASKYFHDATKLTKEFNLGDTKAQLQEMDELERVIFKDNNVEQVEQQTSSNINTFYQVSPDDETRELSTEMVEQLMNGKNPAGSSIPNVELQEIDSAVFLDPHQINSQITKTPAKGSVEEKLEKLNNLRALKQSKAEQASAENIIVQLIQNGCTDIDNNEYLQRLRSDYIANSMNIAKTSRATLGKESALAELNKAKEFLKSNNLM